MNGVTSIANILKSEGIEYLFCFPNNPLIEAAAIAGLRPIISRTERGAINMADGYSRTASRGQIGVCAMQYGPGIENAYGGIAQAYADSVPILLIPTGMERRRNGVHPSFSTVQNYRGITKWVDQITFADRVPEMMRHAFTKLRSGQSGPVLLELPVDVATEEFDEIDFPYLPTKGIRSSGDPSDIREAVKTLLAAEAPVLHVGQGVLEAEAWKELKEFAELVNAPVMTLTTGKSAFPEDHPLSVGVAASTATGMVDHFLAKADLVFGIGSNFYRSLVSAPIPKGKIMIQCSADERDFSNEHVLHHAVLGDPKLVLLQLIEEVKRQAGTQGRPERQKVAVEIKREKATWLKHWMPKLTSQQIPINPYRVIWDLMHSVDRTRTIVTHDSGHPRDQMVPFYEAIMPKGYIGWGNTTQLGYSLGASIGAKLASPEKSVVHVMGDAAFGMAGMDFETSIRAEAPILTILLNNGRMGGYGERMPSATAQFESNRLGGSYTQIAAGMGLWAKRVEQPNDVTSSIRRALEVTAEGSSALLEIITGEENSFSKVSWMTGG